jgi:UDP-3-O-[3-hydroxymyristoyl] glucosamine N-acyltransferase
MPTIAELAERYSARLAGDGQLDIYGLATLAEANHNQLAFLANPLYRADALASSAAGIIVSEADYEYLSTHSEAKNKRSYLVHKNPYAVFARISQEFAKKSAPAIQPGIHPLAVIEQGATVSPSAYIGPFCHVAAGSKIGDRAILDASISIGKDVKIGDDVHLYPNISIYYGCSIGHRTIIHSGAVIGSDGFGFAPDLMVGEWVKVPQIGAVEVGCDVEIGSNTSIDRGAMANTVIEDGCKIDNLVQIAHNVRIGSLSVIAGCAAIAGSTTIGKMCIIGGSANVAGHLNITDRTTISGGTNVIKSIDKPGQQFTSVYPMLPHADWEKNAAILRGLDKMRQRIKELESQIKNLTEQKNKDEK